MASVEKGSQFVTALQAESPTSVEAVVKLVLAALEARREHATENPSLMNMELDSHAEHPLDVVIENTSDVFTVEQVLDGIALVLGNDDDVINKQLNVTEAQGGKSYLPDILAKLATRLGDAGSTKGDVANTEHYHAMCNIDHMDFLHGTSLREATEAQMFEGCKEVCAAIVTKASEKSGCAVLGMGRIPNLLVHTARKHGLIDPILTRRKYEPTAIAKLSFDTTPEGGYSVEHTVNTGRSVYKVDVIDDTVHPHAPVGHVYFGSMAHPKAAEGSGHSALASSKVELLVNLHHRSTFDNRVLTLYKSVTLASYTRDRSAIMRQ